MPDETAKPVLDVLVIAHNRIELTIRCLDALYRHTPTPFHLIVVDDSTDDLTPRYMLRFCDEHKNVTYVRSDTPYKSGNQIFNIGLSHCKTPYMATVMNSVRVEPQWEAGPLQVFEDREVGVVGLKCLLPDGTIESAGIKMVKWMPTDIGRGQEAHRLCLTYPVDAVQWAFAVVRVDAALGRLDEDAFIGFRGWDDIDNCFSIRKAGWKVVYCGAGCGYHEPRATRGDNSSKAAEENKQNGHTFFKRNGLWDEYIKAHPDGLGVHDIPQEAVAV